ncbi:MAG: glucokinase [Thermovirgaceae bacterium]|nr:glucokinase [Thermovirgaceae bacterium]
MGVAGPGIPGRAKITNLSWVLEGKKLETDLGFSSVRLMNDLLSVANAVPLLEEDDLFVLNPGRQDPEGSRVVIAFCKGLGEAYLSWNGSTPRACPSEGGQAILPRWTGFRQICFDT